MLIIVEKLGDVFLGGGNVVVARIWRPTTNARRKRPRREKRRLLRRAVGWRTRRECENARLGGLEKRCGSGVFVGRPLTRRLRRRRLSGLSG